MTDYERGVGEAKDGDAMNLCAGCGLSIDMDDCYRMTIKKKSADVVSEHGSDDGKTHWLYVTNYSLCKTCAIDIRNRSVIWHIKGQNAKIADLEARIETLLRLLSEEYGIQAAWNDGKWDVSLTSARQEELDALLRFLDVS